MKNIHLHLHKLNTSHLLLGLKTTFIIVATLTIFHQDLAIVTNDALQTESMSHILVILFLFAYLIYRKRKMIRAVVSSENQNQLKETRYLPTIAGTLLFITAIVLYWHGSYTFMPHSNITC